MKLRERDLILQKVLNPIKRSNPPNHLKIRIALVGASYEKLYTSSVPLLKAVVDGLRPSLRRSPRTCVLNSWLRNSSGFACGAQRGGQYPPPAGSPIGGLVGDAQHPGAITASGVTSVLVTTGSLPSWRPRC